MVASSLLVTPQFPGSNGLAVGGLYTHTGELFAGLSALGCPVEVLTLPSAPRFDTPTEVRNGVHRVRPSDRVLAIPIGSDGEPTAKHLALYSEELVAYVHELVARTGTRADVLHVHDYFLVPAALQMRRQLGIPLVLSVHILHAPLRTWWGSPIVAALADLEKMACEQADAIIAVSASMKQVICDHLGIAEHKIHVVHNGFDAETFARPPTVAEATRARERLQIGDERVIVYAGRLTKQKGVLPLLRSALKVTQRMPDVVYALAGTPQSRDGQTDERRELLDEMDALFADHPDLASRVRHLGSLSRDELAHVYAVSSLAVVPSVYEPFGYAAIEAVAAGIPVVATAVGGLLEIVQHERTGLQVPVDTTTTPHQVDEAALAEAQLRLLTDRDLCTRLVSDGQQRIRTHFTRERMARETLEVYQRVLR
jgi:glycosyltransferase involved in cell wall biosynthesis